MKTKQLWGEGLFVCNDDNGNPCHIGDTVRITRPEFSWGSWEEDEDRKFAPAIDDTGILILRKSKGVCVKLSNGCVLYPKFTKGCYKPMKWELIKHPDYLTKF